jgi:hypothetical protein
MPLDSSSSNHRRYGFACKPCRNRKIKCGGEKPDCRRCVRSNLHCTYNITDASAAHLRAELAHSHARVRQLEEGIKALGFVDGEERELRIQQLASSCATTSTSGTVEAPQIGDISEQNEEEGDDDDGGDNDYDQHKVTQAEVSIEEDGSVTLLPPNASLPLTSSVRFHISARRPASMASLNQIFVADRQSL